AADTHLPAVRATPPPADRPPARAGGRARAAAAAAAPPGAPAPRAAWADPARLAGRRVPQPGPTAWSRTYWPA
ncbi:hypothetical protein ACFW6K_35325, partial [Streptomyces sp. NPDC058733]|uniref:hypothetical protein n=1 Tax=Streptomyces sp. NPDC058733 TaxID=3346614 RepID=UPI00369F9802